MTSDPFERGKAAGRKQVEFDASLDEETENRKVQNRLAIERLCELLRPNFEPDGFIIEVYKGEELNIWPDKENARYYKMRVLNNEEQLDEGQFNVVLQGDTGKVLISEFGCQIEKVHELAGFFWGYVTDKRASSES